jgi:hypothetical protein
MLFNALKTNKELSIINGAPHTIEDEAQLKKLEKIIYTWIKKVEESTTIRKKKNDKMKESKEQNKKLRKGAAGIIIQDKKVLLIKRGINSEKFPGYWGMPGGRYEQDETPEETVMREVKEETALEFTPTELLKKVE